MVATKELSRNDVYVKEITRLCKKYGGTVSPEQIVEEARPVTSPIHDHFVWTDSEAARLYRIDQARRLLRVTVTYIPAPKGDTGYVKVRAFQSLTTDRRGDDGEGSYRPITKIIGDAELYAQLKKDAVNDMNNFRLRYKRITELSEVFAAMDKAEKKM